MKSGQLWIVQMAETIASKIARQIDAWPNKDKRHPGDQWIRSTDSIGANLVEGYGRKHVNDSLRFYAIAQGSLEESLYWLRKARERKLISPMTASEISGLLIRLSRAIEVFISTKKVNRLSGG